MSQETLGERLKRVRQERELGLRAAAAKAGISATYLSRIENNQDPSPPTEKTIRALAELLDDDFDELMQLAGRVPEDVGAMITGDPQMPEFLRTAREQNVTAKDLLAMLEAAKKKRRGK